MGVLKRWKEQEGLGVEGCQEAGEGEGDGDREWQGVGGGIRETGGRDGLHRRRQDIMEAEGEF